MSVKMRQRVERRIAPALIHAGLGAGYAVSVDNGEEETQPFTNRKAVIDAMFTTDEDRLYFWKDGKRVGWTYLVYGNDGYDVISDYTVNLEPLMERPNRISEMYS